MALAKVLPQCAALSKLSLSSSGIGDVGADALAKVLPQCAALSVLYLRSNEIGPSGAVALAKVLPQCAALKKLCLVSNGIGASGAVDPAQGELFDEQFSLDPAGYSQRTEVALLNIHLSSGNLIKNANGLALRGTLWVLHDVWYSDAVIKQRGKVGQMRMELLRLGTKRIPDKYMLLRIFSKDDLSVFFKR